MFLENVSQLTSRGFNYAGLQAGLALAGRQVTPAEFRLLRVMERAWSREVTSDG